MLFCGHESCRRQTLSSSSTLAAVIMKQLGLCGFRGRVVLKCVPVEVGLRVIDCREERRTQDKASVRVVIHGDRRAHEGREARNNIFVCATRFLPRDVRPFPTYAPPPNLAPAAHLTFQRTRPKSFSRPASRFSASLVARAQPPPPPGHPLPERGAPARRHRVPLAPLARRALRRVAPLLAQTLRAARGAARRAQGLASLEGRKGRLPYLVRAHASLYQHVLAKPMRLDCPSREPR
eukprot:6201915-Pleurochrysis_carterae.AAC.5